MELLPVALPTAGGPAGPAAANFLAGEKASLSARPAGRLDSRDSANEGTAVPLEILPREQDSRLVSLPQLGQALPALVESFSAVWLSAVQLTEGQPAAGSQAPLLPEDPNSENPTAVLGSGAAEAASLTSARKGATAAVKQTVIPVSSLAALVQAATAVSTGGEISAHVHADATLPAGTAETATQSDVTAEIPDMKRTSSIPAATDGGLAQEGIADAAAAKESGIQRAELTEARIVPPGQRRVAPHHDNASLLSLSKALNGGQGESEESAANEHASAKAIQFANTSPGLKTDALQEAAAGGSQNDLPAIATFTEEGRKLGEGIAVTEKLSSPSSSPALLPLAGSNRNSSKAAHAGASQGAVPSTAAANGARLSAMLATVGQEPSASAETAFKAEIRPSTTEGGQTPATSDPDAAQMSRQGRQRAATNLSLQSLSSGSSTGEAGLLSDSSLSQPGNLPAKATASYVADLPGSPRPATASGAPRQAVPAAPPPAAELYAAGLDPARPTTKQASDVTVQLRSEEHGTANIRFREHAGQVQVTVRAGDPQLVQSLRSGLDQLKSGLDTQGFQTTVWSGLSSAASRRGGAEGSLDTYHRAHEDPSGQNRKSNDHSGRGNQQAEEWMDEIE